MTHFQKEKDSYPSAWIIWIVFFSYTLCNAILFQQIILPYLTPTLHAGNGLLYNDSLFFHETAKSIAEALCHSGWNTWTNALAKSPSGNVTVIAVLYAIFGVNPTLIIPINAALHASAGLILIRIGENLWPQNKYRWFIFTAGFLFIIFPSSLNWYAQIHKDGYAILGFYLILYAGVCLLNTNKKTNYFFVLINILFGTILTTFVRPHNIYLYLVLALMMGSIGIINFFKSPKQSFYQFVFAFIIIISSTLIKPNLTQTVDLPYSAINSAQQSSINSVPQNYANLVPQEPVNLEWVWKDSSIFLPKFLDNLARKLSNLRAFMASYSLSVKAGSVVDSEVMPNNFLDFILYLPRASVIGLLAPFPNVWLDKINPLKLVSIAETLLWYLFIPGLLFASWIMRKFIIFWWLLIPTLIILTIESYATANLGTLYRIRYPFIFIFILIGVLGSKHLIDKLFPNKNTIKDSFDNEVLDTTNNNKLPLHGVKDNISTINSSLAISFKQTVLTMFLTSGLLISFFIRDILLARKVGIGIDFDSYQYASFLPLLITSTLAVPLGPTLLNYFIIMKQSSSDKLVSCWLSAISASLLLFFTILALFSFILSTSLAYYSTPQIDIIAFAPWLAAVVIFSSSVVIGNAVLTAQNLSVKANSAALVVPIVSIFLIELFASKFGSIVAAISLLVGQLINLWIVAKECNLLGYTIYPKFGKTYWRKWLPQYLPLIGSTSMISLTIPIGIFFASRLPPGSIGTFSLGAKIVTSFNVMIGLTLTSVALPYFSKKISQSKLNEAIQSLELILLIATVVSIPLALSIFISSNTISEMVFFNQDISSKDLNNISSVIGLGSIQLPFFVVLAVLIKFRVASKQIKSVLIATFSGQLINILISFCLVDKYGINSLAISMTICMFFAAMTLLLWSMLDSYISFAGFVQIIVSWLLLITLVVCLYWKNWSGFYICIGAYILIVFCEIYPFNRAKSLDSKI